MTLTVLGTLRKYTNLIVFFKEVENYFLQDLLTIKPV